MADIERPGAILQGIMASFTRAIDRLALNRLHLRSGWERLLLLSELLNDLRELDNLVGLLCLGRQFILLTEEGLSGSAQLWKPIIDHLFVAVDVGNPDLLVLVDSLLRHSLVEVLLLGAQVAEVDVDLGESGAFLVHFLIGGLALAEDAEVAIVPVARQRRVVVCGAAALTVDRVVGHSLFLGPL